MNNSNESIHNVNKKLTSRLVFKKDLTWQLNDSNMMLQRMKS